MSAVRERHFIMDLWEVDEAQTTAGKPRCWALQEMYGVDDSSPPCKTENNELNHPQGLLNVLVSGALRQLDQSFEQDRNYV